MPFKSAAQRKYLYSQKPEVARKFAKEEKTKSTKMESAKKAIRQEMSA